MNVLNIFWNSKGTTHFNWWLQQSTTGEVSVSAIPELDSHQILKADLACMAEQAQGRLVRVILSARDVHFNQVSLPNKAQRHLRKAVPYLLEEQIAMPVDEMFMAFGSKLTNGDIPVRAIEESYLKEIVEQFKKAEIKLDIVTSDLDCISEYPDGYQVVLQDNQVLVKGDELTWSCAKEDFSWLVQKQLNEIQQDDEMPIAIPMNVVADSEEAYRFFEQSLPAGRFAPQAEIVESTSEYIASNNAKGLNLLQGEYEPKAESSPLKSMLMKVATIAGVVLAVHMLYQGSQWFSLKSQSELLLKERNVLWKQAFPNRKVSSSPLSAMKSFLKSVGGGNTEGGFLSILNSTSNLIKDLNQLYPTNISYNSNRNELRLDVIAKDLATLNNYRDELRKTGLEVEMSSATQRGEGYSSRLIIRSK